MVFYSVHSTIDTEKYGRESSRIAGCVGKLVSVLHFYSLVIEDPCWPQCQWMVLFASYTSEMQLEGKLLFMEGMLGSLYLLLLLPPFQNIGRFDFFRFIYFAIYLDIYYI